jgi:hypothetical protein
MPIVCTIGGEISAHESLQTMPSQAGSIESIEVFGILERLSSEAAADLLKALCERLAIGGIISVSVLDFDRAVDQYKAGMAGDIEPKILGGAQRIESLWNKNKLFEALRFCDLISIRPWHRPQEPMAISLKATKAAPIGDLRNVEAAMSMPRLAWTENMFCAIAALVPLKVNITKHTGAFWGQCLSRLMEETLKKPQIEWILTVDYDSIFTREDVIGLYRLATTRGLDAIAATQVGRERTTVLITCEDESGAPRTSLDAAELSNEILPVATAHFGLTLIRAEALRKLPRPWFHGQPAPDGTWGEGRVDDDIQFWRQWSRAGLKVHQANAIKIGHLQVVISWPDALLQARHQYHNEFIKTGKPDYAR